MPRLPMTAQAARDSSLACQSRPGPSGCVSSEVSCEDPCTPTQAGARRKAVCLSKREALSESQTTLSETGVLEKAEGHSHYTDEHINLTAGMAIESPPYVMLP
ncbi:hypothetical protein AAFF_G00136880 [Aldrovandia affinis]|uniref:Uncharacterized protein n=1 Tax=Aldrovandia affinis TaxID=143900 RepID=A0AAD7TBP0_9TELE|nr:hypothetical protein AAFF_G00136880 [Aldrovandia affinis]